MASTAYDKVVIDMGKEVGLPEFHTSRGVYAGARLVPSLSYFSGTRQPPDYISSCKTHSSDTP